MNVKNSVLKSSSKASIPTKKNPKMIIFDLGEEMFEQEMKLDLPSQEKMIRAGEKLKEIIFEQNKEIQDEVIVRGGKLDVKFFMRKDGKITNAVVEVSPKVRQMMMKMKRLYFPFCTKRVDDFRQPTRCFKCLSFGHTSKWCNSKDQTCSNCNGNHRSDQCQVKEKIKTCINCVRSNDKCQVESRKVDVNHDLHSKTCPKYLFFLRKIDQNVNYNV